MHPSKWNYTPPISPIVSGLFLLCCFLLASCVSSGTGSPLPHTSPTSPVFGSGGPIDHSVVTHGCGHLSPVAPGHNFIVAYGQGLPEGEGGSPFWASAGTIDYGIDDVHYVSLMLDDLQSKLCVDARRIFVTGFSNGGGMSNYIACSLAGRIAAVAPVSGNFYALPGGCHPSRPIAILDIHGSVDQLLPYQGISATLDPPWPLPPIPQWLQGWAIRDGCHTGPVIFLHTAQDIGERWMNCRQNSEVVHYRIERGGHSWPRLLGKRSSFEVMWDFFQSHPLPVQA